MTTRPPLPLIPAGATEIGAAAAMIEDDDGGGRVYVHGHLSFAWDAGDTAGRRFAAVSLMRIKAATQAQVAAAFGTSPLTVWRWAQALSQAGVTGLTPQRTGPRRASKLTPEVIATIARLREQGLSLRVIGERVGVSEASVRRALTDTQTQAQTQTQTQAQAQAEAEKGSTATGSDVPPGPQTEPEAQTEPDAGTDPDAEVRSGPGSVSGGAVPVLADPVDRGDERVLAAFGLITSAPPVFTACARAPLAGLVLALPALAATGLLETAHVTYGEFPNGFYSLDTMLCESVFRALLG
ncbi:MAG: helix-turn-helix domain-containing protein, partial [Actinomycetes bacterium]